jgi:metallo-beta-lactamase family protein
VPTPAAPARPGAAPTLRFLGAARTVTGSRFLIDTGRVRVLVDCGLFQGLKELRLRNWEPFPVPPSSVDAVVLTHAHLDHSGWLPALVRGGFAGPICCTRSTAALATILLPDSGRLQEEDAAYANRRGFSKHEPAQPLYTEEDAQAAVRRLRIVEPGARIEVARGVAATWRRAGHILGSAWVRIDLADHPDDPLLFSGDLGRPQHPILLPPDPPDAVATCVIESTYGDRQHEDEAGLEQFATAIVRTAERGGAIVIPAFAVDRTEVVLLALRRLERAGRIPALPVYVDSPMALSALRAYERAVAEGDPEIRPELRGQTAPFDPAGGLVEARDTEASKAIHDAPLPAVIVSASGMATGGRVLHHLARRLPDPRNTVVLVGYQAEGTRGRAILRHAPVVKIHGRYVPVRAEVVEASAFSVHADGPELVDWLAKAPAPPRTTFVVHGEPEASFALQGRLGERLRAPVVVPRFGERVRLD